MRKNLFMKLMSSTLMQKSSTNLCASKRRNEKDINCELQFKVIQGIALTLRMNN
jgi:hypothetical protein